MTRRHKRAGALVFLFAASGLFIYFGLRGWTLSSLPADYVGYLLAFFGVLGLCGVNIWYGGPLDPDDDERFRGQDKE
jgi:hypothetical protein